MKILELIEENDPQVQQKQPSKFKQFLQNNKGALATGAVGLLGAGLGASLGHEAGDSIGEKLHNNKLEDLQNNILNDSQKYNQAEEELNNLKTVDPNSDISIPQQLAPNIQNQYNDIYKQYQDAIAKASANGNTPEVERLSDNFNAVKTHFQDKLSDNIDDGSLLSKDASVKINAKGTPFEPSLTHLFKNDDLTDPKEFETKAYRLADKDYDKARDISAFEKATNENVPEANKKYLNYAQKHLDNELKNNYDNIQKDSAKYIQTNTPESLAADKQNSANNGALVGGVLGGGASLVTASKLANLAHKKQEEKEQDIQKNVNIYGQRIDNDYEPNQPQIQPAPQAQQQQQMPRTI